jgi:tetratricopeptide (TPR) repeat protein
MALRAEYANVSSYSLKRARELLDAYALSDPSCRGLSEKAEIIEKVKSLIAHVPERFADRETVPRRRIRRSASAAAKRDEASSSTETTLLEKSKLAKERGNELFAQSNYEAAVKSYSMSIRLDRLNHTLYSNRSAAYFGAGKFEDALTDAETCIKLNDTFGKGYVRKAAALSAMTLHAEAIKACELGLSKDASCAALKVHMATASDAIAEGQRRYAEMWGSNAH